MANWALTDYAIEGPKETLQKIYDAINHNSVQEGSSDNWEGNVLNALGITWGPHKIKQDGNTVEFSGYYMRGFITKNSVEFKNDVIRFYAEEAWGKTDFSRALENNIPGIKVYWVVEEESEDIYATNDKEGKYFPHRYCVDTCIKDYYRSNYFVKEEEIYKWLSEITKGEIKSPNDIETFNDNNEDSDDYIHIHTFDVV